MITAVRGVKWFMREFVLSQTIHSEIKKVYLGEVLSAQVNIGPRVNERFFIRQICLPCPGKQHDGVLEMVKMKVIELQRQVAGFDIQTLRGAVGTGDLFPVLATCHFQAGL